MYIVILCNIHYLEKTSKYENELQIMKLLDLRV